jgi:formylglycine-generating enzyme required for sulfatase activity
MRKMVNDCLWTLGLAIIIAVCGTFSGCGDGDDDPVQPDSRAFDSTQYALIPEGSFMMGDSSKWSYAFEQPVHKVTITEPFLMSRTEVTQAQFIAVMGYNPSHFEGENLPVEKVSWNEAVAYCNALSEVEGLTPCYSDTGIFTVCDWTADGYRLPTEAEWEYACRAGTTTDYYTGDETVRNSEPLDYALHAAGWYNGNARRVTHHVAGKSPNDFGLYDMHGNVWEWCWDWWSWTPYDTTAAIDPRGPGPSDGRVSRGGCFVCQAFECRSSYRIGPFSDQRWAVWIQGFRVVRTYR